MRGENFQQNLLYMVSTIFSCHLLEIYSFWVLLLSVLSIFLVCVCVCVCVCVHMYILQFSIINILCPFMGTHYFKILTNYYL